MRFLLLLAFTFSFLPAAHAVRDLKLTQTAAVNLTAAGTAERVSATSVKCSCVLINALAANTGVIYIGDADVDSANGFPLQKGDTMTLCARSQTESVELMNLYFDGGTTNDDIKVSCSKLMDVRITPKPL